MKSSTAPKTSGRWIFYAVIVVAALGIGYFLGVRTTPAVPHSQSDTSVQGGEAADAATIWTCSMHPQIRQPNPGQCPICAMDLIPLTDSNASGSAGPREFRTTPEAAALMDIETALVERRFAETEVRMVGEVTYDETRLAYITAWVPGRIERMYADFTGTLVRKGDHLVDLYSPEVLAAKDELQRAKRALGQIPANAPEVLHQTATSTLEAVRSKLRRWGMTSGQIAQAEASGAASDRVTIYAPTGGTVIERNGQEGMYVETGERIYVIASLDHLWVQLKAYESDLAWLHFGQTVQFSTEANPGEEFEGTIAFIDPTVNETTRTVDVRMNVPNEDGRLKPGMFVRAVVRAKVATGGRVMGPKLAGKWISPMHPEIVKDGPGNCDICGMALVPAEELGYVAAAAKPEDMPLVVPASAPLITGTRAVVYVAAADAERPAYEGREVTLGPRAGDFYLVRRGLREGERVVVNGAFKIDSALEIQAKPSMMSMEGGSLSEQPVKEALQSALRVLVDAYLPLQEALARDDFRAAVGTIDPIVSAATEVADETDADDLVRAARTLNDAEGIAALREAFRPLSNELILLVTAHGVSDGSPLYRVHCPMAFDFEGADWIQRDEEIRSSYFGAEMFACGTVKEQLFATRDHAAAHAEGSGHRHGEGSDHKHDEGSTRKHDGEAGNE